MRRARKTWVGIVRRYERSGLTQAAFADKVSIPVNTVRPWIRRLRREGRECPPLLPVRVIASTAPSARRSSEERAVAIEVELGEDLRLRFPASMPPNAIAELVSLLRRC